MFQGVTPKSSWFSKKYDSRFELRGGEIGQSDIKANNPKDQRPLSVAIIDFQSNLCGKFLSFTVGWSDVL